MERRDIWPEMEKDTDRRCEQESLERDDILKRPGNYRRTESGVGRRVDEHRVDAHLPSLPFSDKPLSPPPLSPLRAIDANPLRVYQKSGTKKEKAAKGGLIPPKPHTPYPF
ncbi:hypothetical protein I352_03579 [Cryptococcus deuterogattii MMRL2647]|nr:hypothetical protein I352_03579 [Cryptococcus deuterogattii MMRL2647]